MLAPEEIERIKQEELLRYRLRQELEPKKPQSFWEKFWTVLNSQFVLWLFGSVIVAGLTFWWNYNQEKQAKAQAQLDKVAAEAREKSDKAIAMQREDSQFLSQMLPGLSVMDKKAKLRAVLVIRSRYSEYQVPAGVQQVIADVLEEVNTAAPGTKAPDAETQRLMARVAQTLDKLPAGKRDVTATNTLQQLPLRVYIQIFRDTQRILAQKLVVLLRTKGFLVPDIQKTMPRGTNPVRDATVFYFSDADLVAAGQISEAIQAAGVAQKVKLRRMQKSSSTKTIEVWLPPHVTATSGG